MNVERGNTLNFSDYETKALTTAVYPDKGKNAIYPALKLNGEAGEVAEKIGKLWRNHGQACPTEYSVTDKSEIAQELGDVLWYINALASEIGYHLDDIAALNLEKLASRRERGVIKSSGDHR